MKQCSVCLNIKDRPSKTWHANNVCEPCFRKSKRQYVSKKCTSCSEEIGKNSRSMLCNDCNKVSKIAEWSSCPNCQCDLRSDNKTGYCNKCARVFHKDTKQKINSKYKDRMSNDIHFRLKILLRKRLNAALKNNQKTGSAVKDLGCSIFEFKNYLEARFQPGMNWENQEQWHIDHIKPLSSFDLSNYEQLKIAAHYTNIQPLWAKDNLIKGAKHV